MSEQFSPEPAVVYDSAYEREVAERADERRRKPRACSHCGVETSDLNNHSRHYGGNVGAHWLCEFCEVTQSASRLGAGGRADTTVQDVAAMLHILLRDLLR